MSIDRERLLGAWRLVRWAVHYDDGRVALPFGDDAEGLLVYAPEGWMSAGMWRRQRSPLSSGSAKQADALSKSRALDEYLSYSGTWALRGADIVHDVTSSLNPALIGTRQVRHATLEGSRLRLGADEDDARGARHHRIEWERATAP